MSDDNVDFTLMRAAYKANADTRREVEQRTLAGAAHAAYLRALAAGERIEARKRAEAEQAQRERREQLAAKVVPIHFATSGSAAIPDSE